MGKYVKEDFYVIIFELIELGPYLGDLELNVAKLK